jgi:predicted nucleic acid-binding protein
VLDRVHQRGNKRVNVADRLTAYQQAPGHTVTSYDAWYVALAEALELPLATLDGRLSRARGVGCKFLTPGRQASR